MIYYNAAWTEANIYLTTNKKTQHTFIFCIRSHNLQKDETLCYHKKITQSLLRLLGGLRAMNGLEWSYFFNPCSKRFKNRFKNDFIAFQMLLKNFSWSILQVA